MTPGTAFIFDAHRHDVAVVTDGDEGLGQFRAVFADEFLQFLLDILLRLANRTPDCKQSGGRVIIDLSVRCDDFLDSIV